MKSFAVQFLAVAILPAVVMGQRQLPPKLDDSINRGLSFLAKQQNQDGSFEGGGPRIALTGLTLMAFLANGHTPDVGEYGAAVRQAIDFLIAQMPEEGYYGKIEPTGMYGQGIATLALLEAYGVEPKEEKRAVLRAKINKALAVIISAQAVKKPPVHAGGWRYEPTALDSDLSLSGWNSLALRAAHQAGFSVPKESVQNSIAFILQCYDAQTKAFAYEPGKPAMPGPNGIGVLCMYLLGGKDRPEVAEAAKFLAAKLVDDSGEYFYYSLYHTVLAAELVGEPTRSTVTNAACEKLIAMQTADGGWPISRTVHEPGRVYTTAMSVLTLSAVNAVVPVHEP